MKLLQFAQFPQSHRVSRSTRQNQPKNSGRRLPFSRMQVKPSRFQVATNGLASLALLLVNFTDPLPQVATVVIERQQTTASRARPPATGPVPELPLLIPTKHNDG